MGADGGDNTELLAANRKVKNCLDITCDALGMTNGQYENTMPTWAPPGDLDWVAFNSLRPYGVVYPTGGTQQIWVAAVDRSKVGQLSEETGPEASIAALLSAIPYFRIAPARAKQILKEVEKAVAGWRKVGRSLGMSKAELDQFEDAFEHPERRTARSG